MIHTEADLSGQTFRGASIDDAHLRRCDISGACFAGASVRDARFEHCRAYQPTASGEREPQPVDFRNADLRGAQFDHCDLSLGDFSGARLYDVVFRHCRLQGADFSRADFTLPVSYRASGRSSNNGTNVLASATFDSCNMAYANLSHTTLCGCVLIHNRMIECALTNTRLDNADLRWSDLHNAHGSGMSLRGADLRHAVFNRLDPRLHDLAGVRLSPEQVPALLAPLGIVLSFDEEDLDEEDLDEDP